MLKALLSFDPGPAPASAAAVPHVVAWNITRRCNLACAHCYISAGSWHSAAGELDTRECLDVVDQILAVNPNPMLILSGGEPLARTDLEVIAAHASKRGATVVVGTNGVGLTRARITSLKESGVRGVAVSVDSLDARYHNRFRHGDGALEDTLAAIDALAEAHLDFIIQTTLTRGNRDELETLAFWAAEKGAVSFNLYFLVATGRGEKMQGLSPQENDAVLQRLLTLEAAYRGRMLVRSKCQPQIMRHVHERAPGSPLALYATRCPCGVQYCRITPEAKVTPCPYSPVVAGDLRQESFAKIWSSSPVFAALRQASLGGKCGACEYRLVCGGCRARAYAESGDYLAEDPSCAYTPDGSRPLVTPAPAVTYGAQVTPELVWSAEAKSRIERVPSFVRGVVVKRVEDYARQRGAHEITLTLLDQVRRDLPVDFSKRLPFFLR